MPPTKRGTLKSRGNWKIGYGWPYVERKEKVSALMGWSQNNRLKKKTS